MTDFKTGDRIALTNKQTEFRIEGVAGDTSQPDSYVSVRVDGTSAPNSFIVKDWYIEKVKPALPTKVGSVIRVTKWGNKGYDNFIAMLTAGGWATSLDSFARYSRTTMDNWVLEFEVIYTP